MAMESLMDYVILAFLLLGLMAFFGTYAIGWMTLRAAVNACVAVFGISSFAMWARRQKKQNFSTPSRWRKRRRKAVTG